MFIKTYLDDTYRGLDRSRVYRATFELDGRDLSRFHHISTDKVYRLPEYGGSSTKNTPYMSRVPYSKSEAGTNHLRGAWVHEVGLPILITNCSSIYGPFHLSDKLVPLKGAQALGSEPPPVHGAGANVRDWLAIEDHASALQRVFNEGPSGHTFNFDGNVKRCNAELVEMLCAVLDRLTHNTDSRPYARQISFVADRLGHVMRKALGASRTRNEVGWTPRETSMSGIERALRWCLGHQIWWRGLIAEGAIDNRRGLAAR